MSRIKAGEPDLGLNTLSPIQWNAVTPKIFVVDDDEPVRKSLKVLLDLFGYAVETFESGEELLAHDEFSQVACIIMDVNLPGASGLETLTSLRDRDVTTPVFIVTGNGAESVRQASQRLKAAGYFEKPVEAQMLLDAIKTIKTPVDAD